MRKSQINGGMWILAVAGCSMGFFGLQALYSSVTSSSPSTSRQKTAYSSSAVGSKATGPARFGRPVNKSSSRKKSSGGLANRKVPLSGSAKYYLGFAGNFMQIKKSTSVFDSERSARQGFPRTTYLRGKTVEVLGEIGNFKIIYKPEYPGGKAYIDSSTLCQPVK